MQIEHDQDEPPKDRTGNFLLYAWAVILPALWAVFYFTGMLDWHSACLGALTGGVFVIIMTEITGNKVPKWMR